MEGRAAGQASERSGPRGPEAKPLGDGARGLGWCDRAEQGRKSGRRRGPSAAKVSRGGSGLVGGPLVSKGLLPHLLGGCREKQEGKAGDLVTC